MKKAYEGFYNFVVLLLPFGVGVSQQKHWKQSQWKIHERALRLVYDDSPYLNFDELLIKDKSVSIHLRNLHFLASETSNTNLSWG